MPSSLPPLNALRAFEVAARCLSFKQAAEELHVTPAAVSQQIKALEHYLGLPLFRRTNRVLQLTPAAQAGLPKVQEGFACLVEAVEQFQERAKSPILTISVAPSLAAKWLVPRLHRFAAVHPDIDMRISASMALVDGRSRAALADFRRDGIDLAIRFGRGKYPGFQVDKLFSVAIVPMCSPRLLEGEHPLRKPEDLRHHVLLHDDTLSLDDRKPDWNMWLKAAGVRQQVDANRGQHFSHTALALNAALEGQGVVLSIKTLAAADLAAGRLVIPFALSIPLDFAYYLVCPEAIAEQPMIAAFRAWLLQEAQSETVN